MKKGLLLFFAIGCSLFFAHAQQLSMSQMQAFGSTANYTYIKDLEHLDLTKTGTGVTWDFSQLQADPDYTNFTVTIAEPKFTPYGKDYPNSNYAYIADYGAYKQYSYFQLFGDSMSRVGSYNGNTSVLKTYSNFQTEYVFPLKVGAANNDTWMNNVSMEGGVYNLSCEASGTLLLPGGKSYDAFFVKVVITEPPFVDALAYFWYDQKDGGILTHYFLSDNWLLGSYAYYAGNLSTGLDAPTTALSFTYNNPVQSTLKVSGPALAGNGFYSMSDATGIQVKQGEYALNGTSLELECESLNKGIYTLTLASREGVQSKPIRFVKL